MTKRMSTPPRMWSLLAAAATMYASTACAPMDTTHSGAEDADAGELDDKQLPSTSYQAEARTAQNGCAQANNNSGYTGSGFMDFGGNGTWIEWNNITAPAAGRYELRFRFANGGASARGAAALVNGQNAGNLRFGVTGSWTQWSTDTIAVSLRQGANTVRLLANTSTGGPNVDRLDVVATDLCPSDPAKTEPGSCGCGVPEGSCSGTGSSGTASCALANEGSSVTLSCASGQTIKSITFASYGTPNGSCQTGLQASTCNAASSRGAVEHACLGKATCTVLASNGVFSDPCAGTAKRLGVTYQCGTGTTQPPPPPPPPPTSGFSALDRSANGKLRVASWNVHRGSVFPKTDSLWRVINNSGTYDTGRTEGAARIFNAVDADIWLLQENVYTSSGLPSGVTLDQVDAKIRTYMQQITGDNSWVVRCNGRGLCLMMRGNISLRATCTKDTRVNAYLVELRAFNNASLLLNNVHYMNSAQASYTRDIVTRSTATAKFVAGDFNDVPGGTRYNTIAGIAGMSNVPMSHLVDPGAVHVAKPLNASPKNSHGAPLNTKGYVGFGPSGHSGQDRVAMTRGGHIDHFFLGSAANSFRADKVFVLNTLLLSQDALIDAGLEPLDVALTPLKYAPYFASFMNTGTVSTIPASLFDHTFGLDHDHLPMVIDFSFPNGSAGVTPSLACP